MNAKIIARCLAAALALGFSVPIAFPNDQRDRSAAVVAPTNHVGATTAFKSKGGAADQVRETSDEQAQWVAARAAVSSACAAWAAVVVGGLTLGSAVVAAFFAYKAAKHGETSAAQAIRSADAADAAVAIAREAARTDLRAWLSVSAELLEFKKSHDGGLWVDVKIAIRNIGQTPALDVATSANVSVVSSMRISPVRAPDITAYRSPRAPVLPGDLQEWREGLKLSKNNLDLSKSNPQLHR